MGFFKKFRLLFGGGDVIVMDVGAARVIADMQKDLDAYRFSFANIVGHLKGKFGAGCRPAMMKGLAADEEVSEQIDMICTCAFELRRKYECLSKDYDKLIGERESLKGELERLRKNFDKLAGEYDRLREGVYVGVDIGSEDADVCACVVSDVFGNVIGTNTSMPRYDKKGGDE